MSPRSRRWIAVLVVSLALMSGTAGAQDYCPTCYTSCTFLDTFFVFCIPVEQGVTGTATARKGLATPAEPSVPSST